MVERAKRCFYFPLEPVESRYTHQLCNAKDGWMPSALREAFGQDNFWGLYPSLGIAKDITVGAVLDAHARTTYALRQCSLLVQLMADGDVATGDVVYLQDFYTPGFDAILYASHLYGIKLRCYAMLHAQSVDEHDFTFNMREWMRPLEESIASQMDGIFVASTVHKKMLEDCGVIPRGHIHVVGLPFNTQNFQLIPWTLTQSSEQLVVFTSRMDREKNPEFMIEVALAFLEEHPEHTWVCTTSAKQFRSYNVPNVRGLLLAANAANPRFQIAEGLRKAEYHEYLARASIHFNCSSQDFVSWTLIESQYYGCTPVFPDVMSFPECLPGLHLYRHLDKLGAVRALNRAVYDRHCAATLPALMDQGRLQAARIAHEDTTPAKAYSIWPKP